MVLNPDQAAIARGMRVKNDGERPVWLQVTARGVPKEPQPAAANGLSVQRAVLHARGEKADLARLRQNDRLIVSIDGRNLEGGYHEVALLDLLPAGFEIETVLTDDTVKSFPFLAKLTHDAHRRRARRPLLRLLQPRPAALSLVVGRRRQERQRLPRRLHRARGDAGQLRAAGRERLRHVRPARLCPQRAWAA